MNKQFPEMVDAYGYVNDIQTFVGKLPMSDVMKFKEIIGQYFGHHFADEDSEASTCLYAFEEFLEWQKQQHAAIKEMNENLIQE